jgi:hypothetical protein
LAAQLAVSDKGRTNCTPGNGGFRKRCINDPLFTKFIQESTCGTENPAATIANGNVFADYKNSIISGHFFCESLIHSIQIK